MMSSRFRLCMVGVLFLSAGIALAGSGEIDVVVNMPGRSGEAHVVRKTEEGGKAWVVVDPQARSVTLVNFPSSWTFNVSPTREDRPSIQVRHGAGSARVLVRGYIGDEMLTESVLDESGEAAELMLLRCSIEAAASI